MKLSVFMLALLVAVMLSTLLYALSYTLGVSDKVVVNMSYNVLESLGKVFKNKNKRINIVVNMVYPEKESNISLVNVSNYEKVIFEIKVKNIELNNSSVKVKIENKPKTAIFEDRHFIWIPKYNSIKKKKIVNITFEVCKGKKTLAKKSVTIVVKKICKNAKNKVTNTKSLANSASNYNNKCL